ncbi:MAG: cupin domain-containing protein [Bacteroidetes bacterium]|nr:MAG: cupin domain-containing protein [Bacteroidota bacterium]
MKICISIFLLLSTCYFCSGQNLQSLDTIKPPDYYENIYNRPLYSDSLASSFVIFIKKEVKSHKHVTHTEHIYILDGTGEMLLGEKKLSVKKGDIIFIPKNTFHSLKVTSQTPVKVLSVQSPRFDGTDRVVAE